MRILKIAVIVIIAVMVSRLIGAQMGKHAAEQHAPSPAPQATDEAPIVAMVTSEDSGGGTQSDLDQEVLRKLEGRLLEIILEKGRKQYAEFGHDPKNFNPKVEANSVYLEIQGKKLAVIKMNLDNTSRVVVVGGIKGSEFVRVQCMRPSNHDVPLFRGTCAEKIREIFGVSIP